MKTERLLAGDARGAGIDVCLGSPNRHWTFDLGRELEQRGMLKRLYTMYPRRRVETVPGSRVRSFPFVLGAAVALDRLGWHASHFRLNATIVDSYDRWLSRVIEPCDLFHCISSFGVRAHARAKSDFGAVTVCDRGCAHISYQDEIVEDEKKVWGYPPGPINPRIVHRELAEYEMCDLVTVPSPFAMRTFIARGVAPEKIRCVPFAADLTMFRPEPKEDDVFRVLYVGAIALQKGVPYLLEALADLDPSRFELWLVGPTTPETDFIFERFKGSYRYFGPKPRKELAWYYSQASVFVLPSVQDGFGMVMAQAMACGVPVIATTNTGVDALFDDGEAGYHVPIRDAAAIRDAVARLSDEPDTRDRLAARALERAQAMGGWNAYGDSMAAVHREAVGARR